MNPKIVLIIGVLLIVFFFVWFAKIIVPVIGVEAKYQYTKVLTEVFHTSDIRGLVWPQFHFIIDYTRSKHKDAGLTIPKIFVDEPIVFNIDPNDETAYTQALKIGIAHASSTALPDNGGIGYYFAHSSQARIVGQINAIFYLLGKLEAGDKVHVWKDNKHFDYEVKEKRVTSPTDVSFLSANYPTETIVLQTCWPPATTAKRLLVFAERTAAD